MAENEPNSGATFTGDSKAEHSAYAEARVRGAFLDLSGRAKWHLTGTDRVRYLNGQVTNDVRRLRPGVAMSACVTNAKGRLSGLVFISAAADFLRIDAEPDLREPLTARLERYIIADDATLLDVTEDECLFHVLTPSPPAEIPGTAQITATRLGRPGVDFIAPHSEHSRILAALCADHVLLPASAAESLRIEAGVPLWGAELKEETLPPEAGLDRTAIDYNKGCYIGQEVISRIKSVGHVNRRLAGFTASSPLAAGMVLVDPDGKPAGEITSAAWSFGLETWAGLGYLKRGIAGTALESRPPDGPAIQVQIRELPLLP